MKFKFWGVRGSIPTPGPQTVKYGGNTTCIEIRTNRGDLIILDAGTGIHALAQTLLKDMPIAAHIFITHTHWDHIQGLPFFLPIFFKDNRITIYGGRDPVTDESINRALSTQLQYSYFPIHEAHLKARVDYQTVINGEAVCIGSARITPTILNHPVLNFGYRIDCDGRSLFFTGDFEIPLNLHQPGKPYHASFQAALDAKHREVVRAMQDVDALIVDSSYTDQEYANRQGWGHGTHRSAIKLALEAHAKRLFLTHHEPTRTDAELDRIHRELRDEHPHFGDRIFIAREGEEVLL